MAAGRTPLVALDAVAIDTETTGLDPANARIVQVAGVRIRAGKVGDEQFSALVDPGVAIPAQSTAIHGIDADRVRGAPSFAEALVGLMEFTGERVLVGHHIGFDIAVMGRECRMAGIVFAPPATIDTALLAAIVEPGLPATSLEAVAEWLGAEISGRHSAPGDALTAARIFVALLPHLRQRGIRTLAEAQAACRTIADAMVAAGHPVSPALPPLLPDAPLAHVDAFAFAHRCRDLMSAPPQVISADQSLSDAVAAMTAARVSSLFVVAADGSPQHAIVTERDIMRMLATGGRSALERRVSDAASKPLITVSADDFAFRAIGRMTRHAIRHLAVVDKDGAIVGALSARDLMRVRSSDAVGLGDDVAAAGDAATLAAAFSRLPGVASGLLDEGIPATGVAAVISGEMAAMTARAGALAAHDLEQAGLGAAPTPYALVVLGSAGRGESLLAPDQDNGIVHGDTDDPQAPVWFAALGTRLADILDEAGVPYCKGGVMASNAAWRASVSEWSVRVATWIGRSTARDLLNVDIFFDLAGVSGETRLADDVWRSAYRAADGQIPFLKLLSESTAGFAPPLNFLGGLRTQNGRLDLKAGGLFPIVASARLLSLRYGIEARATPARLAGVRALNVGADADIERMILSHALFVDIILRQQIEDIAHGVPPSNRIAPALLSPAHRSELKDALSQLRNLETTIRDLLFGA